MVWNAIVLLYICRHSHNIDTKDNRFNTETFKVYLYPLNIPLSRHIVADFIPGDRQEL